MLITECTICYRMVLLLDISSTSDLLFVTLKLLIVAVCVCLCLCACPHHFNMCLCSLSLLIYKNNNKYNLLSLLPYYCPDHYYCYFCFFNPVCTKATMVQSEPWRTPQLVQPSFLAVKTSELASGTEKPPLTEAVDLAVRQRTVRSCFIGVFLAGSLMQVCVDGFCKKCLH